MPRPDLHGAAFLTAVALLTPAAATGQRHPPTSEKVSTVEGRPVRAERTAGEEETPASLEDTRAARVLDAQARLGRDLVARNAQGGEVPKGVDGSFVERTPGSYVFVPSKPGRPQVPVANPADVSGLAVGLPLTVEGRLENGRLRVESYEIASPTASARGGARARSPERVRGAVASLFSSLDRAIKPGAVSLDDRSLESGSVVAEETRESVADFVDEYRRQVQSGDLEQAEAIAADWATMRTYVAGVFSDEPEYKALYGFSDNYPPWRYGLISRQAPAVVALGEPGGSRALCSGVLLAPDLVLTAGHCFAGPPARDPLDLEIWFDFAQRADRTSPPPERRRIVGVAAPPPERWPDLMEGKFASDLLDFAIVRFERGGGEEPTAGAAEVPCLRERAPNRSHPLYVLGYPRGGRVTVHANARVYLPFRELDGDRFFKLRLDVHADLLARRPELSEADLAGYLEEFDDSYELHVAASGVRWRYLYSATDEGQPRMGIVADTFGGNSGGPVYDHENEQCVVGILIAGAKDTGERRNPNWAEHERVLPIGPILAALDETPSTAAIKDELTVR